RAARDLPHARRLRRRARRARREQGAARARRRRRPRRGRSPCGRRARVRHALLRIADDVHRPRLRDHLPRPRRRHRARGRGGALRRRRARRAACAARDAAPRERAPPRALDPPAADGTQRRRRGVVMSRAAIAPKRGLVTRALQLFALAVAFTMLWTTTRLSSEGATVAAL